jgi:hypothetical protein
VDVGGTEILVGNSYYIYSTDGYPRVIRVHDLREKNGQTVLVASHYLFQWTIPRLGVAAHDLDGDDHGRLLLSYENWDLAGTIDEVVDIPISQIQRVVERCDIRTPGVSPPDLTGDTRVFTVSYGAKCITHNDASVRIEVRSLPHPGDAERGTQKEIKAGLTVDLDLECPPGAAVPWEVLRSFHALMG